MISVAEELIDRITAAIHYLRVGKTARPIDIPEDLPDNEIRQLITYVNRFLVEFSAFSEALAQMAQGELHTWAVASRMAVVQSLKTLHSNLRHLTWKTQQVADGDLEQKVDFMGDFSTAFNSMTQQLKDSREQLLKLNEQLETRNRFIRETFGRYTSDDIVEVLLDMPEGLKLGGEKRELTILMTDLRGFTAMVERLEPTAVVALLNNYLSAMIEIIQQYGGTIDEIIGIVKAYTTRVGEGPLPTELLDKTGEHLQKVGHEFGTTTSRPRRCGWLDLVVLKHSCMISGITKLAITKLDVLNGLPEINVCTQYLLNGKKIDYFPASIEDVSACKPVYTTFKGWTAMNPASSKFSDLPKEAQAYLRFIEKETDVPITLISIGPGRDETIEV